jgi:hypothetical protein
MLDADYKFYLQTRFDGDASDAPASVTDYLESVDASVYGASWQDIADMASGEFFFVDDVQVESWATEQMQQFAASFNTEYYGDQK